MTDDDFKWDWMVGGVAVDIQHIDFSPLVKARITATQDEMIANMNKGLYGEDIAPRYRRTWRDWIAVIRWRVIDAWAVLTGTAEIG